MVLLTYRIFKKSLYPAFFEGGGYIGYFVVKITDFEVFFHFIFTNLSLFFYSYYHCSSSVLIAIATSCFLPSLPLLSGIFLSK